jgi:DNA-binding transcriptional regulator YiaG
MNSTRPSGQAVAQLMELLERRGATYAANETATDELALAALEISEAEGVSRRQLAAALGVGPSTVQGWVKRGERLRRGQGPAALG